MAHPYSSITQKEESGRLWRHVRLWSSRHPSHGDTVVVRSRQTCCAKERDEPIASSSWPTLRRKTLRRQASQKKEEIQEAQPRAEEWVKIWAFSDYNGDRTAERAAVIAEPAVSTDSMTRQSRAMSIRRKPVPTYDGFPNQAQENLAKLCDDADTMRSRRRMEIGGGDSLVHRRPRPRRSQDSIRYARRRESVVVDLDTVGENVVAERLQELGWTATELGDMLHQPRPVRNHSRRRQGSKVVSVPRT